MDVISTYLHLAYYHNTLASLGFIMLFKKYGNFKNILFLM